MRAGRLATNQKGLRLEQMSGTVADLQKVHDSDYIMTLTRQINPSPLMAEMEW